MTETSLKEVQHLIVKQDCGALLFVLPADDAQLTALPAEQVSKLRQIESWLMNRETKIPIYFARADAQLDTIVRKLEGGHGKSSSTSWSQALFEDRYHLQTTTAEPRRVPSVDLKNLQGWLPGVGANENADLPTFAIVAHYDTFGTSTSLATGSDNNGSGVVALLELARLFGRMYEHKTSKSAYNLLFMLTAGGKLNFAGANYWLSNADSQLLDSVDFALCLDSIGRGEELYLHLTKEYKDPVAQAFYASMSVVAEAMQIPSTIVKKPIAQSQNTLKWEHEQFTMKRVMSATLSHLHRGATANVAGEFSRTSLFDSQPQINTKILQRNIRFVAESIARVIYANMGATFNNGNNKDSGNDSGSNSDGISDGSGNGDGSSGGSSGNLNENENEGYVHGWGNSTTVLSEGSSLDVDATFVRSWSDALGAQSRFAGYSAENSIERGIEASLALHVPELSVQSFMLSEHYGIYTAGSCVMTAFRVKSPYFDVCISLGIMVYLFCLYMFVGGEKAWEDVKGIFISKDVDAASRKKRK
jgi:hypothetical protein